MGAASSLCDNEDDTLNTKHPRPHREQWTKMQRRGHGAVAEYTGYIMLGLSLLTVLGNALVVEGRFACGGLLCEQCRADV